MVHTAEEQFRFAEAAVDRMVRDALPVLRAAEISIHDRSNREGFRGDRLMLALSFQHQAQASAPEIAMVTVTLGYNEPVEAEEEAVLELDGVAEIFQIGKESRCRQQYYSQVLLAEVEHLGLANLISALIDDGYSRIDQPAYCRLNASRNRVRATFSGDPPHTT